MAGGPIDPRFILKRKKKLMQAEHTVRGARMPHELNKFQITSRNLIISSLVHNVSIPKFH